MPLKLPVFSRNELISASKRDALITETAEQIIKDFAEFSLDITFSGNPGHFYDELYHQMFFHINELMSESNNRFQALLYRIDVSQKDIDMYHRQMPNANYNDVLTELIIHREIKKIMIRDFFRSKYKNNNDDENGDND
ncbi:MAG: hypothetical protein JW717_03820 [Marinilabiliaceae bacterium]|nr:hypothetical protein [Marinilabiliaceae bacterium]